jgi:metal transporter CNNM
MKQEADDGQLGSSLTTEEARIIRGALNLTLKPAHKAMTPINCVNRLSSDTVLNEETLTEILAKGHSRIPVHRPDNPNAFLGILLVKELILVDPRAGRKVSGMKIRSLPHMMADTPLHDMLEFFKIGRSHMAVLVRPTDAALEQRDAVKASSQGNDRRSLEDNAERRYGSWDNADLEAGDAEEQQLRPGPAFEDFRPEDLVPFGIITIEDVLEELLGTEIIDETDMWGL